MPKNFDVLIIGFGLTGAVLAFKLKKAGRSVLIVDPNESDTSSKIAGGMWNPIVFKRINKCWNADLILPSALSTYSEIQEFLGEKIMHEMNVIRVFPNPEYANDFAMKTSQEGFSKWLSTEKSESFAKKYNDKYDHGQVTEAGRIDLKSMLSLLSEKYLEDGTLVHEEFDEGELIIDGDNLGWKGKSFGKAVFCRGHRESESKFFGWLPLRKTKGDILDVEMKKEGISDVINNSKFIIPVSKHKVRLGSTYDHHFESLESTQGARERILEKTTEFLGEEFEITKHSVGIRPTVKDRKPVAGFHPEFENVAILNGMGTRGVLNAPWTADQLIENMVNGTPINDDVNIARF